MYAECITEKMLFRVTYFVLCVKMNSRTSHMCYLDAVHNYERFRKEENIIASSSTTQDTFNALSRFMFADDEESIIDLSRFL